MDALTGMATGAAASAAGVLGVLAGSALRGAVLLGLAGLAALTLRRASAASRHLVWTLAVLGMLALPVATALVPSLQLPVALRLPAELPQATRLLHRAGRTPTDLPHAAAESRRGAESAGAQASAPATVRRAASPAQSSETAQLDGLAAAVETRGGADHASLPSIPDLPSLPVLVLLVWAVGAVLVLAGLAVGTVRVRLMERASRPVADERRLRVLAGARAALTCRREIRLLEADGPVMPMTWGLRRPVVLLPAGSSGWPDARLAAVLRHEVAHVARRDHLTQLAAELACALYWFNPLVWIAGRRLRLEREHACDDAALAAGARASDYAQQLLEVARTLRTQRSLSMAAMAMARPSELTGRLLAVLDTDRARTAPGGRAIASAAVAAALVVGLVAAAEPARAAPARAAGAGAPPDATAAASSVAGSSSTASSNPAAAPTGGPAADAVDGADPTDASTALAGSSAAGPCGTDDDGSIHINANDDDTEVRWTSGDCTLEMKSKGTVRLTDDLTGIRTLGRGASLELTLDDGTERSVRATSGPNGPVYRFRVAGHDQPFDAEAQRWFHDTMLALIRRTGWQAEARVSYLLSHGGPDAVIAELGDVESSYARGVYFRELTKQADLTTAQVTDVIRRASRNGEGDHAMAELLVEIANRYAFDAPLRAAYIDATRGLDSDYERSRTLQAVLDRGHPSPADVEAVLRSAAAIGSDYERSQVLRKALARGDMTPGGRRVYLDAAAASRSDYERGQMLQAFLERGGLGEAEQVSVLTAAAEMGSDHERAQLMKGYAFDVSSAPVQKAYVKAVSEIGSDYETGQLLGELIRSRHLGDPALAMVLVAARRIGSDHELAQLLLEVARSYRLTGPLRDAFLKTLDGVDSGSEHDRVASELLRQETG